MKKTRKALHTNFIYYAFFALNCLACNDKLTLEVEETEFNPPLQLTNYEERLMTLGYSPNISVSYGHLSFGGDNLMQKASVSGLRFTVRAHAPHPDGYIAFGTRKETDGSLEVRSAVTADGGATFTQEQILFQLPAPTNPAQRWLTEQLVYNNDQDKLLLAVYMNGIPPTNGHPLYVFEGNPDGTSWGSLQSAPVYLGQDALCIVWNDELNKFVNYQTTFQPYTKRYPDNMPYVRRVLHIRTSSDGIVWDPDDSFGVSGPYLDETEMILPDSLDEEDLEFYRFSVVNFGEFWGGIMLKYLSRPPSLGAESPYPHGPFFGYEWWISPDGFTWSRPFRDQSQLTGLPLPLMASLSQPFRIGDELRWSAAAGSKLYAMDRKRMFYAYSSGNAEITTQPFVIDGVTPLSLEVSFGSIERGESSPFNEGYLMAELLDNHGDIISGFGKDNYTIGPTADESVELKWETAYLPDNSVGDTVKLRLTFRDVKLYSLSF